MLEVTDADTDAGTAARARSASRQAPRQAVSSEIGGTDSHHASATVAFSSLDLQGVGGLGKLLFSACCPEASSSLFSACCPRLFTRLAALLLPCLDNSFVGDGLR